MLKLNATTTLPMLVLCATSLSPVQSAHAAGSPPPLVQSLCQNCHGEYDQNVEPWYAWRGSMMAHATRDPLFWASLAVAEQDHGASRTRRGKHLD